MHTTLTIDTDIPPALLTRIKSLPNLKVFDKPTPQALAESHIVYSYIPTFSLTDAPNLKWVQLDTASVFHAVGSPLWNSAIPIANVRGAYTVSVAEFAVGLLLMLNRKLHLCHEMKLSGAWLPTPQYPTVQGTSLYGKTVGIVGYGSIAGHTARILHAMGANILAWKKHPHIHTNDSPVPGNVGDPQGAIPSAWFGPGQLTQMFPQCDIIIIALPQTSDTLGLVTGKDLASLPKGAKVINVGRGATIDEPGLIALLQSGHLAGAALDVFHPEPPAPENPLWKMPNVIMAPHIASYTDDQTTWAGQVLLENLQRHLTHKPLINLINRQAGY